MKTKLSQKILKLRAEGKTYTQISKTLSCSKGTISYYCGKDQKLKSTIRQKNNRSKQHPLQRKVERFKGRSYTKPTIKNTTSTSKQILLTKIYSFHNHYRNKSMSKLDLNFTVEDVINKVGKTPKCYLTGVPIDLENTKSYQLDHRIPVSRGGTNTLDNLEIATKAANQAKGDMTPDEFRNLCKLVVAEAEIESA